MAWTQTTNIRGASGIPGASGASGASGLQGASGVPGATGPTGSSGTPGASGASGSSGASGASGVNYSRNISTITANATIGSSAGTDYVVFSNIASIPAGDTSYSSVTALLPFDGSNGSTTITDSSSLASNWTATTASLSTSTKKFGTAALNVNGGYITSTAASTNFTFGTSDFCIEFWAYFPSFTNGSAIADFRTSGTNGAFIYLGVSGTTIILFVNSGVQITSSSLSTSTWYHVALARSGNSTKLFINGTQSGSTWTDNTNYSIGSGGVVTVGRNTANSVSTDAYLDDFRITKGVARYTTNFTAPSAALPVNGNAAVPSEVTLPSVASVGTSQYTVKNIHPSDTLALKTTSSQTIDGATGYSLTSGSTARLISDSSNWRTI